jgi:Na+/phosphate symporter
MNNLIRKDILRILTKVKDKLKNKDVMGLNELSNHINHNSSIFQDEDSVKLAVIVYSLSKIIERNKGKVDSVFIKLFIRAKNFLKNNDYENYRKIVNDITNKINEMDSKISDYLVHVLNQAGIKKGSKLLSNGISLPRVAEIMNVSQWELINYVGKTNISDKFDRDTKIKQRIEFTRKLFNEENNSI